VRYVSTRGRAPALGFDDVLLAGLAVDGGLYVPEIWPRLAAADLTALRGRSYAEVAATVMAPYVGGSVVAAALPRLTAAAYGRFAHAAVAPLKQLAANAWLMELFHGPTFAFKDYALQVVGLLFEEVLKARGQRITIVGATSGDTGSAAIEACRGRANIDIFILHPAGRTSEVQRRQMTTVDADNVHNIALAGTFDDCQEIVKALFADAALRAELNLSAVNSINWARIMAQIVYYVWAGVHLGAPERMCAFAVPTGNFGNVFAGYAALRMGLPVARFLVGSNRNDILTRYFETGAMTAEAVQPSLSPSMDIQVSSNFERLLFEAGDRDGEAVTRLMAQFKQSGRYAVDAATHARIVALFAGRRLDDEGTKRVMREVHAATGETVDPHTAVGIFAARDADLDPAIPRVALATAHPAKFPDAVAAATGKAPAMPAALAAVFNRSERFTAMDNNVDAVKRFIRGRV
jgi:threonine synthase